MNARNTWHAASRMAAFGIALTVTLAGCSGTDVVATYAASSFAAVSAKLDVGKTAALRGVSAWPRPEEPRR